MIISIIISITSMSTTMIRLKVNIKLSITNAMGIIDTDNTEYQLVFK